MANSLDFDFIYQGEANPFSYFVMPKVLIRDKFFKDISLTAKLIYTVLLDRTALSKQNENFVDEEGKIYIIFPVTELIEETGIGRTTIMKNLAELEKAKLIKRKRCGSNKPNIIYVKNFLKRGAEKSEKKKETDASFLGYQMRTSGSPKSELPEVRKVNSNKPYINNTYINKYINEKKRNREKEKSTRDACVYETFQEDDLKNHELTEMLLKENYITEDDNLILFNDFFANIVNDKLPGQRKHNFKKYLHYFFENLKRLSNKDKAYEISNKFGLLKTAMLSFVESAKEQFLGQEKGIKSQTSNIKKDKLKKQLGLEWLNDVDEFLKETEENL